MTPLQKKCFEFASSYYLSDELPSDWDNMDDEEFYLFLEHNAWEPFECADGEDIYSMIDSLADGVQDFIDTLEVQ